MQSNRWAVVGQIAEEVTAASDRKVSEHTGHHSLKARRQASRDSVVLWPVFCWETLGPAIHVDVTLTPTTYLSIVADHVHPFMETVFPDGRGLFQQDNATKQKGFSNGLRSTTMRLRWWLGLHIPQISIQSMEAPPRNLQDLKNLLQTSWCQIPEHTVRGLVESIPWKLRAVLAAKGGPTQY